MRERRVNPIAEEIQRALRQGLSSLKDEIRAKAIDQGHISQEGKMEVEFLTVEEYLNGCKKEEAE